MIHLNREEHTLLHVSLFDASWLEDAVALGGDVPDFTHLVRTTGHQHVLQMWAESGTRAALLVGAC